MPERATPRVKICGLTTSRDLAAAVEGGAAYVGFVIFPPSPRHLTLEAAAALAAEVPPGICKVVLTVDPDDALLDQIAAVVPVDMIQLHGAEPPARVAEVRARTGLPVMKALGISGASDLGAIQTYAAVADQLLIDAKAPSGSDIPGGNGLAFDWSLMAGTRIPVPWMLAGGLTPENVSQALRLTGAAQIDVSSGVERKKGVKDPARITAFLAAAHGAAVPSL